MAALASDPNQTCTNRLLTVAPSLAASNDRSGVLSVSLRSNDLAASESMLHMISLAVQ